MRHIILLFLLLSVGALRAQTLRSSFSAIGEFGSWTAVNDSTYTGTFSNWSDALGAGYRPSGIEVGYWMMDASGRLFRVTQRTGYTFSSATMQIVQLQPDNVKPAGIGAIFEPVPAPGGDTLIPPAVFHTLAVTPVMRAKMDIHNTQVIADALALLEAGGGANSDDWGDEFVRIGFGLIGRGTLDSLLRVDTTALATPDDLSQAAADIGQIIADSSTADRAYADALLAAAPAANAYLVVATAGQEVMAISDGSGEITATKNANGDVTFTIPAGVERFEIHFGSEWAGKDGANDLHMEFVFQGTRLYNQSATTMRRPDVTWWNRDGSGFSAPDVRDDDNVPQHQFALFGGAGICEYVIKRVDAAAKWGVTVRF